MTETSHFGGSAENEQILFLPAPWPGESHFTVWSLLSSAVKGQYCKVLRYLSVLRLYVSRMLGKAKKRLVIKRTLGGKGRKTLDQT